MDPAKRQATTSFNASSRGKYGNSFIRTEGNAWHYPSRPFDAPHRSQAFHLPVLPAHHRERRAVLLDFLFGFRTPGNEVPRSHTCRMPGNMEREVDMVTEISPEKIALSVKETAQVLGISINKTYELLNNGTIRHRRIGAKYLVSREWLENWIKGR